MRNMSTTVAQHLGPKHIASEVLRVGRLLRTQETASSSLAASSMVEGSLQEQQLTRRAGAPSMHHKGL